MDHHAYAFQIRLFHFSTENLDLVQECPAFTGHIECLQLKVKDDFVLFCDLMQSLTLLRYDANEKKFERVRILWLWMMTTSKLFSDCS